VDLRDTPDEAQFRDELRRWIATNLPAEKRGGRGGAAAASSGGEATGARPKRPPGRFEDPFVREWSRRLYEAGYAGLTWPKAHGGAGAPYSFQAILYEELAAAQAATHVGVIGLGMAGPTIIAHGTEEQKARYLRPILAADEIWCQGFSEPDAGSDLAAVRTRAERRGDVYVVNGQKVWSSFAHIAERCILVAQSDPGAPRHRNLTYLLVDMRAPGVEVRPLRQITGEAEFNEIFFTEVAVPVEDRLGDEGEGWQVAMTTLLHERATLGFALSATFDSLVRRLLDEARRRELDPRLREALAREWIELQALRSTNYRALGTYEHTGVPGPEGSAVKLRWSEANQRLTKLAREVLGPEGILDDGWWNHQQLRSRGNTIEAGTSEVLRNIIAERVLGLPRSR